MKFIPLKPARINGKATKAYIKAVKEGWGSMPSENVKTTKPKAKKEKFVITDEILELAEQACLNYQNNYLSRNSGNGQVVNPNAKFPPGLEAAE